MATGLLVAIGQDTSPPETSRRVSGTWDSPVSVTGTTDDGGILRLLTDDLWFTIDSTDGSNRNAKNFGPGSRSKDGGDTWGATPQMGASGGLRDIAKAADGRLWCIVHVDFFTKTLIYYSDDDGDTWVLSTTHGSGDSNVFSLGWNIMCHPTDPDIIAIVGFSVNIVAAQDGYILYSTNRGVNWAANFDVEMGENYFGAQHYHDAVMLSSGRIIFHGTFIPSFPRTNKIYYTDDFGATLILAYETDDNALWPLGIFVNADESTVAVVFGDNALGLQDVEVWSSANQGSSFTLISLATELNEADFTAMASDSSIIYVGTGSEEIYQLTPVSAAGVWTSVDAGFPHVITADAFLGVVPSLGTTYTYTSAADGDMLFSGDSVDVSVNIPETPDPEDSIIMFHPFSATFKPGSYQRPPPRYRRIMWEKRPL